MLKMQQRMAMGRGMQGMALYMVPCFSVTSSTSDLSSAYPAAMCTFLWPDRRRCSPDTVNDARPSLSPDMPVIVLRVTSLSGVKDVYFCVSTLVRADTCFELFAGVNKYSWAPGGASCLTVTVFLPPVLDCSQEKFASMSEQLSCVSQFVFTKTTITAWRDVTIKSVPWRQCDLTRIRHELTQHVRVPHGYDTSVVRDPPTRPKETVPRYRAGLDLSGSQPVGRWCGWGAGLLQS